MAVLSFIEKEVLRRLFGISDGYIFKYWSDRGTYNKNTTRQLILEACGIDIYNDAPYRNLSQQKCVEKIWNECSPQVVANLLEQMANYFCFSMGTSYWCDEDGYDYRQVQEMIERLRAQSAVVLPAQEENALKLILSDIESNIQAGKPELVIDRLHTFTTQYIRTICQKHGISIADENGNSFSLGALVGRLKGWYERENYFESEFCVVAIRNTINIFAQYNDLRNNRSAAHPNQLLSNAEAEYAVKVVADTLMFIDKIETSKDQNNDSEELPF